MTEHDKYRQLVRRAIAQSLPLETLELIRDVIKAIEAMGQKPEDVFKRIIEAANHQNGLIPPELMTDEQHLNRTVSILQQLADLGVIPTTPGEGIPL